MYGKIGKIGLIVPSVNTVAEPDTNRMAPEGVGIYAARARNLSGGIESDISRAASELADADVDVIAFSCTSASFSKGIEGEAKLRQEIEEASGGIPAVTTSGAVASALQKLGVERVVVATPYSERTNQLGKRFLESNGTDVLDIRGMRVPDSAKVYPEAVYQFVRDMIRPSADGIFISCTNLPAIDVIEKLEDETGLPVVTSNQATLWRCLQIIGYKEPIAGYGRLFL